ncbi:MAG: DUF3606 domain-containing protein [Dokdonella sp.]
MSVEMLVTRPHARVASVHLHPHSAIDLGQSWQSRWWADYFGVSRTQLLVAIMSVGTDATAVKRALHR